MRAGARQLHCLNMHLQAEGKPVAKYFTQSWLQAQRQCFLFEENCNEQEATEHLLSTMNGLFFNQLCSRGTWFLLDSNTSWWTSQICFLQWVLEFGQDVRQELSWRNLDFENTPQNLSKMMVSRRHA